MKTSDDVPIIVSKNSNSLKLYLVKSALPDINEVGRCKPSGGKKAPCLFRINMKNTSTFKSKYSSEVYQVKKHFDCKSKMVVYFKEFCGNSVCGKQYCGSTMAKVYTRANNYKSTHRNSREEQKLSNQARNQKHFHKHYLQSDHNRIFDWEITIIDYAETKKFLWQICIFTMAS